MPPPAHIAATRYRRRGGARSSWVSVTSILAPVAATGWPSEQPAAADVDQVGSMSSSLMVATHIAAKASLISEQVHVGE